MEQKRNFEHVMGTSVNMALATSVDGQPNVRVVTYGYDKAREGRVFFSTFKGCRKIQEFAQNPRVACQPLPLGPEADAQVRIFGEVRQSDCTLKELIALIGKKAPGDAETLIDGGDMLKIYEIRFTEAWVTVGMNEPQRYVVG